jgi:hypothetical protein
MKRFWLAALLVGMAAGCGGSGSASSKARYEGTLRSASGELNRAFAAFAPPMSRLATMPLAEVATKVAAGEKLVLNAKGQLARARPPSNVRRDNAKLVASLNKIAEGLDQIRKAAAAGDRLGAESAATALVDSSAVTAGSKTDRDLQAHGYSGLVSSGR